MDKRVKYFYIRDPMSSRVMTVARALDETRTKIAVGFAVSKPATEWEKGDQFCKSMGRHIATERLRKHPVEVFLDENERPMVASAKALANCDRMPKIVRKLASGWLKDFDCTVSCNS